MDNLEFIIRILEATAWPLTTLLLVLLLRREIRSLLGRVKRLRAKDIEADFEPLREFPDPVKIAESQTPLQLPSGKTATQASGLDLELDGLLELSDQYPRAAVLQAWLRVETTVRKASRAAKLPEGQSTQQRVRSLVDATWLPDAFLGMLDELRRLRNIAAHVEEFNLSGRVVREYVDGAINMAAAIEVLVEIRTAES